jgi:predicted transcriptional regulator
MESEKKYTVEDLARITNRSSAVIYRLAKKLGRLPTIEEIVNRKTGRPPKY